VKFEEFLAARLDPLLRYATVVTCNPHLAQDIVQDVLLRAQSRWRRIGAMDAPEQYVRRMILNEFLSWRRRPAARLIPRDPVTFDAAGPGNAEATVDERDQLLRLIAALPPKQRAVIALRYYEDLSDQEIAGLLGCRPVTVRTQAMRALSTLRRDFPAAHPQIRPQVSGGTT
jgi:RNA polymerase sigma-70 factor (sigma-E family)